MKKEYESIFTIDPVCSEDEVNNVINKFKNLITGNGGEVINVETLGKRKLAYEIKHKKEGIYVLINIKSEPAFIAELERNYKITNEVIRYLTLLKHGKS